MDRRPTTLRRHLGLVPATALAVTMVIGGGALALPGAAIRAGGDSALFGWILASVITIPLLVVFARLGAWFPSAGGVAGFVRAGLGSACAAGVEVVLMGTFLFGLPAIALSGGGYLTVVLDWPADLAWIGATALLLACAATLLAGAALSANVQTVLAIVLTVALATIGWLGLASPVARLSLPAPDLSTIRHSLTVVGIVFFGFTGWETLASTTAEYRDPRRDFPRVVTISFVIVVAVYLLLAAGIQAVLPSDTARLDVAPVAEVVARALSPSAAVAVAVLGVGILGANLLGNLWGASRLVYSSADEGILPRSLAVLSRHGANPHRAIVATTVVFLLSVGASGAGLISVTTMYRLAGQNLYLVYLVCAVVYGKVARRRSARLFGVCVVAGLGLVALAGFELVTTVYPFVLFSVGFVGHQLAQRSVRIRHLDTFIDDSRPSDALDPHDRAT